MFKKIILYGFILSISLITFSNVFSGTKDSLILRPHDLYPDEWLDRFPHSFIPLDVDPGYSNPTSVFINVNLSQNTAPQNEPSVKISRKDPNRVVAAWRDFRTGINPALRRIGYSYSTDGGTTWSVSALLPQLIPNAPLSSDPVVEVDTAGNFYIMSVSLNQSNNNGELWVFKSFNQGVTFDSVYLVANGPWFEDKEWTASDLNPSSPFVNTLYVSWTRFTSTTDILLSKSTNGGANWSIPVNVSDLAVVQGSMPAIGPNGEIYIAWRGSSGSSAKIYFDKSTDGGVIFGTDKLISPAPQAWFPSIATDLSGGPRNGYIYVTWNDESNGDDDVFLSFSSNGGTNWSVPKRINNDAIGNGRLQYWPWISVNDSGNIAIIFYDTRNTPNNNIIEAYLARSTDGGQTFTNELLSTQQSPTNTPNSSIRFGDYIGIDYLGSRIVPVWTDERAGGFDMEIYTAVINTTVGIQPISNKIPSEFELYQNYPNPFNPYTEIRYKIAKFGNVKIIVYDMLGRSVMQLVNERHTPGEYVINFDGNNISSGVYFYKIEFEDTENRSGNFQDVKKMVLLK
ncbi:MAG: T9SS type A sorting domain-containing protein [Ignavibacteria bacterium]|nr:T9SS type A sorting domain-containing protein [Ignavibacteria bacterium]